MPLKINKIHELRVWEFDLIQTHTCAILIFQACILLLLKEQVGAIFKIRV